MYTFNLVAKWSINFVCDALPIVLGTWLALAMSFHLYQFIVLVVQEIFTSIASSGADPCFYSGFGFPGAQRQLAIARARLVVNIASCVVCFKYADRSPESFLCLVIGGNVAIAMLRPHALTARGHSSRLRLPAAAALIEAYQVYGAIQLNAR